MGKQIIFVEYETDDVGVLGKQTSHSWKETEEYIRMGCPMIQTTQMGLLSTQLFEQGYRIFVAESSLPGNSYEIKLGSGNERTSREIKMSHNLFKMWQAGEFRKNS